MTLGLIVLLLLVGTFHATERTRRMEQVIRQALARIGWTLEQAAQEQQIDPAQWHRQLTAYLGQTPSLYRHAELPDDYQRERIKLEAPDYGLIVLERDQVSELLAEVVGTMRMAKMELAQLKKEKVS